MLRWPAGTTHYSRCWRPAAEIFPSIDNHAKQLRRAVSIIFCGVGLRFVEIYASNPTGSGQYRLTEGQTAESCGVEARKGVERVALESVPCACCSHKSVIEVGVVAD